MPVIEVKMWKGGDDEIKAKIIRQITDIFISIGVLASAETVLLTEFSKKNWREEGKPISITPHNSQF